MLSAYKSSDIYYKNHNNKTITFNFNFKKRIKTKTSNFLKQNKQESDILKYCKDNNISIEKITSNKYIHYFLKDE